VGGDARQIEEDAWNLPGELEGCGIDAGLEGEGVARG